MSGRSVKLFRYRLVTAGLILLMFITIGWLGSGIGFMEAPLQEVYNKSNLIRLHIIANSDSAEDQSVKLKVRDRMIHVTEPLLLTVESQVEAEEILRSKLDFLKQEAIAELEKNHCKAQVQVELGRFQFPEKNYFFGVLPAGEYHGLRVILGEGKGHNWWCVLYPPLCLLDPNLKSLQNDTPRQPVKVEYRLAFLEKLMKKKGIKVDDFWRGWNNFLSYL